MTDIPPELQPESEETSERRKRRMWVGIGVPTAIAALLAIALGVWWWVVLIFCLVVAAGIVFGT